MVLPGARVEMTKGGAQAQSLARELAYLRITRMRTRTTVNRVLICESMFKPLCLCLTLSLTLPSYTIHTERPIYADGTTHEEDSYLEKEERSRGSVRKMHTKLASNKTIGMPPQGCHPVPLSSNPIQTSVDNPYGVTLEANA
jgi:hypothetical protein